MLRFYYNHIKQFLHSMLNCFVKQKPNFFLYAVLFLGIFSLPLTTELYAQGADFKFDRSKPIEVTADSLIVSDNQKTGEFLGNVQIIQDTYKLTANRIIILYSDNKKNDNNLVKTLTAYDNVYLFTDKHQAAKAQKMIYNLETKILTLSGDVLLTYDNNTLKGNEITVNTQTKHIQVKGTPKQRVKALLTIPE